MTTSNIDIEHVKNIYGEDKMYQLLNELTHNGSDGLVNYFLYEAEEEVEHKI